MSFQSTLHSSPLDFNPSPAVAYALVSALAGDLTASLAGLAAQFDTSIEALTLWMTRPDIADRLDALESAFVYRTRLAAANCLPLAVASIRSVLADFNDIHSNAPYERSNLRVIALRTRAADAARRAAAILLRLANFTPGPKPRRAAPTTTIAAAPAASPRIPPQPVPAPLPPLRPTLAQTSSHETGAPASAPAASHPNAEAKSADAPARRTDPGDRPGSPPRQSRSVHQASRTPLAQAHRGPPTRTLCDDPANRTTRPITR